MFGIFANFRIRKHSILSKSEPTTELDVLRMTSFYLQEDKFYPSYLLEDKMT